MALRFVLRSFVFLLFIFNFFDRGVLLAHSNAELIQVVDVKSLVLLAKQHSPEFHNLSLGLERAQLKADQAFFKLFPRLKWDSQFSRNSFSTAEEVLSANSNSPWQVQNTFSVVGTLYDNGTTYRDNRIARLEFERAKLEFRYDRDKKTLELISAYLEASLKNKLTDLLEQQLELLKKQFKQIDTLYRQGLKTQRDFLRFKAQLARREIEFVGLKSESTKSQNDLLEKLGFEPSQKIEFSWIDLEKIPENKELSFDFDSSQFLLFQINRLGAQITSEETWAITQNLWPELNFAVSAGHNFFQEGLSGAVTRSQSWGWKAQLGLSYTLFDWGIQKRERGLARINKTAASLDHKKEYLKSLKEIEDLRLSLDPVKRSVNMSRTLLDLEKTNLSSLEREYQNGKLGYLELVSGYNDFAEAQQGFTVDVAKHFESYFKIEFYKGTLYENLVQ